MSDIKIRLTKTGGNYIQKNSSAISVQMLQEKQFNNPIKIYINV